MATTVQRQDSQTIKQERDACVAELAQGKSISSLSEHCKELLGAVSKTGLIVRRDSAVAKAWNPQDGHGSRSHTDSGLGLSIDKPEENHMTVGEIFLESKSPEEREKIKKHIARTASQGAKVRSQELVSDNDIQREKNIELIRRASREKTKH